MEYENNLIVEKESADVKTDACAFSLADSKTVKTIGKTTYIANLFFREQGQPFSEKLKRVLRADSC